MVSIVTFLLQHQTFWLIQTSIRTINASVLILVAVLMLNAVGESYESFHAKVVRFIQSSYSTACCSQDLLT